MIGASAASATLAETLIAAGIPTTVSANIGSALWSKLIVNCAYNALSAIGPVTYGPMMATEGTRDVITAAIAECLSVANACGVTLPGDITETTLALAASMPAQSSSTAQDLARGKPTEIEFLNGHIVRKGREHGIPTPTNLALLVAVRLAEKGRARPRPTPDATVRLAGSMQSSQGSAPTYACFRVVLGLSLLQTEQQTQGGHP